MRTCDSINNGELSEPLVFYPRDRLMFESIMKVINNLTIATLHKASTIVRDNSSAYQFAPEQSLKTCMGEW
jgi:hypothetical protein